MTMEPTPGRIVKVRESGEKLWPNRGYAFRGEDRSQNIGCRFTLDEPEGAQLNLWLAEQGEMHVFVRGSQVLDTWALGRSETVNEGETVGS